MSSTPGQNLDVPIQFEFQGKTYQVSRIITFEMEVMASDWVKAQALARIERQKELGRNGPDPNGAAVRYERALDRYDDNLTGGRLDWEGDLCMTAINQWEGSKHLMLLRFRRYDPTVTVKLIVEIYKSVEDRQRLASLINPPAAGGEKQPQTAETQPAQE